MPFYRFHIDTPLSPEKVIERLSRLMHPYRGRIDDSHWSYWGPPDKGPPFVGHAGYRKFSAYRIIRNGPRGAWHISATGAVQETDAGSRLSVTQHMSLDAALFFGGITLFFGAWAIRDMMNPYRYNGSLGHFQLFMFVVVLAAWLLGFYCEALKSKRLMAQALETRPNER